MAKPVADKKARVSAETQFLSNGFALDAYLAQPEVSDGSPVLLICQDFPHGREGFEYLDVALADRVAEAVGWLAFVFNYRGCGNSEGSFSFGGWKQDIDAAISHLLEQHREIWIAGFGVGATLGIRSAAENRQIQGVAAISASDGLQNWTSSELMSFARRKKAIREEEQQEANKWAEEMQTFGASDVMDKLKSRPLLVIHGQEDQLVPMFDARAIADAHGSADLRILEGGGHNLRYDPRTLALLFGWLDRNRHFATDFF